MAPVRPLHPSSPFLYAVLCRRVIRVSLFGVALVASLGLNACQSSTERSEPSDGGRVRGDPDGGERDRSTRGGTFGDPDGGERDDMDRREEDPNGFEPNDDVDDSSAGDVDVEDDGDVAPRRRRRESRDGFDVGPVERDEFFATDVPDDELDVLRPAFADEPFDDAQDARMREAPRDDPYDMDDPLDDVLPDRGEKSKEDDEDTGNIRYRGAGAFRTPYVDRSRERRKREEKTKAERTRRRRESGIPQTSEAPGLGRVDGTQAWAVSGKYRNDPRFKELARTWSRRVDRAVARLHTTTGLRLPEGQPPRVVLTPLGDERKVYELRGEVVEGHNHLRLLVNAEPLVAKTADPDRTLLHSLGASVLETLVGNQRATPVWLARFAGLAAAGDLSSRLDALHRRFALGERNVLRVDPADDDTAEATALAAMLLLTEEGNPRIVRQVLAFAADGDDPHRLMGRFTKQPDGAWVEPAMTLLHLRIRTMDDSSWKTLERAQKGLADGGRAAMESELPTQIPREIRDEVHVLLAEAALMEGDSRAARELLRGLPEDAAMRLRDPAHALSLLIRAESATDGDKRAARTLMSNLDRDFPKSEARRKLLDADPMLGLEEDPLQWLDATRERVEREGPAFLDLKGCAQYARMLLADHRAGAAESFVMMVGKRALAPELHELGIAITDAQEEPSPAARAQARERIDRWLDRPREVQSRDVVDCGCAAAQELKDLLLRYPDGDPDERDAIVAILLRAAGPHRGLDVLAIVWKSQPQMVTRDLDIAAGVVPMTALRDAALDDDLLTLTGRPPAEHWREVSLGMPGGWLEENRSFLRQIRDPAYLVRHRAFSAAARATPPVVTRALLDRVLLDPAALMRRDGALSAGSLGHGDLVARAIKDKAWVVRQAACGAAVDAVDTKAVPTLVSRLDRDPSPEVRKAAALGLLTLAPRSRAAMVALLRLQRGPATPVQDMVAQRLARMKPVPVAWAVHRALVQELGRKRMKSAYLYRLFALFQRVTGVDVGFHPGSKRADTNKMVSRVGRWVREARADAVNADATSKGN